MRAAELTKQLLGFARRGKLENVNVDLQQAVDDVIAVLRHTLDKRIIVITAFEQSRPLVAGDPTQLQQVLLNLAVNARDAMPEGGMLTFETRRVTREGERAGEFLRVSVIDTGAGIPDAIRPRIFEPFFTTKPRDQGTGMGLAMVYGIVRSHGGWVEVESAGAGQGTRFDVYLPVSSSAAAPPPLVVPAEPPAGTGRILVVDDEPSVREVVDQILPPLGYQVAYATNGQEALAYYRDHPGEVDLVVLDLVMPVMNGTSCFRALQAVDPHVRAILMSGHGVDGVADDLLAEGLLGFLAKPFTPATLAQAIAGALTAARAGRAGA
jgi:CheY-like chemotaxis protein